MPERPEIDGNFWEFIMKKIALPLLVLALTSACSQTHVDVVSAPPSVTPLQQQIDDHECAKESEYHGYWIFKPFYYGASQSDHEACMIRRGYILDD